MHATHLLLCLALSNMNLGGLEGDFSDVPGPRHEVLQADGEELVRRALIPNERHAHGEVRLVRRDGALCLQTILCTPELERMVKAIDREERRHWPAGADGHADSRAFLAYLGLATADALELHRTVDEGSDARRKLLIELILDGDEAWFGFASPEIDTSQGRLDVVPGHVLSWNEASTLYLSRAMRLQLAEAFHLNATQLDALLPDPP